METNKENILTCQNCGSTDWHKSFTAESMFKGGTENTIIYVGDTEGQYNSRLVCSKCNEEHKSEEKIIEKY